MKIIDLQLETHHENNDAVAWYAYVETSEPKVNLGALESALINFEAEEFGVDNEGEDPLEYDLEEKPNKLSRHTGLRRFYVRDFELAEDRSTRTVAREMKATVLVLDASCGPDWRYCDSNRHTKDCWKGEEVEIPWNSIERLGSRGIHGICYRIFKMPGGRIVAIEAHLVD